MKLAKKISLILAAALIIAGSAMLMACGNKQLTAPTNVVFDISTGKVNFDTVENADRYFVSIYKVTDNGDEIIDLATVTTNEAKFNLNLNSWIDSYYAEVYAAASDAGKYPPSKPVKSATVKYNTFDAPMYRVVKSASSANPKYVRIQLNPAQFNTVYKDIQAVPPNIEFKIYDGTAATGTPIFTKTVAGSSLSVTGTAGAYIASEGFTFDVTSAISTIDDRYTITAQVIGGTVGKDSALNTYTYSYTDHGTNVTNTNAGTFTSVTGYTFTNPA